MKLIFVWVVFRRCCAGVVAFLDIMAERRGLVVSDSRLHTVTVQDPPGWRFDVVSESSLKLLPMLDLANKVMRENSEKRHPDYDILILNGLLCDLSYRVVRPRESRDKYGMMRALLKPRYTDMLNLMTSYTAEFQRAYGLKVMWTVPYIPNFYRHNRKVAHEDGEIALTRMQIEEADFDQQVFTENVEELKNMMNEKGLLFYDLGLSPYEVNGRGCDGLHLPIENRQLVLDTLVRAAITCMPCNRMPLPAELALPPLMNPDKRLRRKEKRRRNKLNRQVRGRVQHGGFNRSRDRDGAGGSR